MAKKKFVSVKPKGSFNFHTFSCDTGGVGAIRSWVPSILMSQYRYKQMSFIGTNNYTYSTDPNFYSNLKFLKFQRPAEKTHVDILKDFKYRIQPQVKVPLYLDIDDLLFDIPQSNSAWKYYKEREKYTKECLSIVDGICASTPYMKKSLQKYNSNISILPNYIGKFFFGQTNWKEKEYKKPRIIYPGSFNHFNQKGSGGDFDYELIEFIKQTVNIYEWHFIGGIPFELKDNNKVVYHPWQSYFDLPAKYKEINPTVAIAPLEDNEFNKCKSNIKSLEYAALGIPGLFQDLEPYKRNSYRFSNTEEFIHKLMDICKNPELQKKVWKTDYEELKDELYFEDNQLNWINAHLKLNNKILR